MYFSSKKHSSLSVAVLLALAASVTTPVMAAQKLGDLAQPWLAEIAASRAISDSALGTVRAGTATQLQSKGIASATTLASNEDSARRAIVGSGRDLPSPLPNARGQSNDEPIANLAFNESAAQAAISQNHLPKKQASVQAEEKKKVGVRTESEMSSANLLARP